MPVTLPPPTPKTGKSKYGAYKAWAVKNGIAAATAADIWYWSKHTPNVDPYLWSSVLLAESGAHHLTGNGQINSSGQAVGIGQIALSHVGEKIPWNPTKHFTNDNDHETGIQNYGVNLRFSAYLWGNAVSSYGWQKAYTQGYNPNDPNRAKAWAKIQKTYGSRPPGNPPIGSPSQGPADTSPTSQKGTTTTIPPFTDFYVAGVNKQGKFALTKDPNKAMQYDGAPLTRSSFLSLRDQLTKDYISYTGKRPSIKQIANYIQKGWNPYTLDVLLSKSPSFTHSPIYKRYAANFGAAMKDLLPPGAGVPVGLIRQAAVNDWDGNAIAAHLRKRPEYLQSNEYKGQAATLANVYQSIMGMPDEKALISVHDAVLAGWTADQYAAFLRGHKDYSKSPEYQSKALGFLDALGMFTGSQTILTPGNVPGPGGIGPNTQGNIPRDKRVKGNPNQPYQGLGLMPTLSST